MRNLYHKKQYVRINGGEWVRTGWGSMVYVEDDYAKEETFESREHTDFDKICEIVDSCIWNSESRVTIFGNKVLSIRHQDIFENLTYRRKEVKTFEIKMEYTRRNDFTIRELSRELNADDFCEYLKDRGLQNIVIS